MNDNVTLKITKLIKAPRHKVFSAWITPELMKRWYAPGAMIVPSARSDAKVGGSYQIEMRGEMGGKHVNPTVGGTYRKIIPDELISFTWGWVGDPSPETLVTVTFKEIDGVTEVTLTHERFATTEAKEKHQHGWTGCLDNLAKFLETT
jgi:uncharacterized protein YndB with AHSA1/START domain